MTAHSLRSLLFCLAGALLAELQSDLHLPNKTAISFFFASAESLHQLLRDENSISGLDRSSSKDDAPASSSFRTTGGASSNHHRHQYTTESKAAKEENSGRHGNNVLIQLGASGAIGYTETHVLPADSAGTGGSAGASSGSSTESEEDQKENCPTDDRANQVVKDQPVTDCSGDVTFKMLEAKGAFSHVITPTPCEFRKIKAFAKANDLLLLVNFYASWCPHCQHMMPVISHAADLVSKLVAKKVLIIAMDCADSTCFESMCTAAPYTIQSFPTFYLFFPEVANGNLSCFETGELAAAAGYIWQKTFGGSDGNCTEMSVQPVPRGGFEDPLQFMLEGATFRSGDHVANWLAAYSYVMGGKSIPAVIRGNLEAVGVNYLSLRTPSTNDENFLQTYITGKPFKDGWAVYTDVVGLLAGSHGKLTPPEEKRLSMIRSQERELKAHPTITIRSPARLAQETLLSLLFFLSDGFELAIAGDNTALEKQQAYLQVLAVMTELARKADAFQKAQDPAGQAATLGGATRSSTASGESSAEQLSQKTSTSGSSATVFLTTSPPDHAKLHLSQPSSLDFGGGIIPGGDAMNRRGDVSSSSFVQTRLQKKHQKKDRREQEFSNLSFTADSAESAQVSSEESSGTEDAQADLLSLLNSLNTTLPTILRRPECTEQDFDTSTSDEQIKTETSAAAFETASSGSAAAPATIAASSPTSSGGAHECLKLLKKDLHLKIRGETADGKRGEKAKSPRFGLSQTSMLWAVFHLVAHNVGDPTVAFEFMDKIMEHWMLCAQCRTHYIEQGRPFLQNVVSAATATSTSSAADASTVFPVALWQFHNLVSTRIAKESTQRECDFAEDEDFVRNNGHDDPASKTNHKDKKISVNDRRWPTCQICPDCWKPGVCPAATESRKESFVDREEDFREDLFGGKDKDDKPAHEVSCQDVQNENMQLSQATKSSQSLLSKICPGGCGGGDGKADEELLEESTTAAPALVASKAKKLEEVYDVPKTMQYLRKIYYIDPAKTTATGTGDDAAKTSSSSLVQKQIRQHLQPVARRWRGPELHF
ncbi:unnamed protein product [Amoebophrya sp. A120]|nr:unnamed protein product [Amoebophrya sp. A120]|eukprot:GSA120T00008534001.1